MWNKKHFSSFFNCCQLPKLVLHLRVSQTGHYIFSVYEIHVIFSTLISPDSYCFLKSKVNHKKTKENSISIHLHLQLGSTYSQQLLKRDSTFLPFHQNNVLLATIFSFDQFFFLKSYHHKQNIWDKL